jgi:hypothetical protein
MPMTPPPDRPDGAMKKCPPHLARRSFLRAAASVPLLARAAHARSMSDETSFTDGATLVVAGSASGRLDRWADLMAPSLERALPSGTVLRRQLAGGDDGVSGANQFDARAIPDGGTALLLPGEAALAWLAGDPRARYDVTRWVPVMAGWTPGIIYSRVPIQSLGPGARLRVAAADPGGPDLAALLGLELLRIEAVPLFRVDGFDTAQRVIAAHAVDAVFLHGENVPQRAAQLEEAGLRPLFGLGVPDANGGMLRDPMFKDVQVLPELLATHAEGGAPARLFAAWRAAAAAAQMDFALVLPQLTPAAMVALWRRAGSAVPTAPEMQTALTAGVRASVTPAAITASLAPDAAALVELRRWLVERYNWQPA